MTKWEYRTLFMPNANLDPGSDGRMSPLDHQLAQLGAEGWELVTVVGHARTGTAPGYQLILKRARREGRLAG